MRTINYQSLLLGLAVMIFLGCKTNNKKDMKDVRVKIETTMGDIVVKLYEDTPQAPPQ